MKRYITILAILLLVMGFGITGAVAQPMGQNVGMQDDPPLGGGMMCGKMGGLMGGGMMMSEHHIRMMLSHLGLDQKQKEQIDRIILRTKKDMIKRKAELKIAEVDLEDIISKDPVDMKAAESKLKEIESMKTAMTLARLSAVQEGKAVLTPEQRAKLKEMMEKHMMGGGMMEGGMCGGMMKGGEGCGCGMMKGDMMKGMEHHDHEKMMK